MKLPERGMELGEWVLEERLGAGAFGQVWRGRHNLFKGLHVALKIPHTKDAIESLAKEGVIQAELDHPGIVKALGIDPDSDPPYFVMDYVDGSNLREYLVEKGPLPLAEVESTLRQILDALAYAHERGVIHQDIKPENILLTEENEVKLTDFGIARINDASRTKTGIVLGTPSYMPPEQLAGKNVTGHSDIFSLGVTLYQLLSGQLPFRADSMAALMYKIASKPHLPISELRPDLGPAVDKIVDCALSKLPEHRQATAAQFAEQLRACRASVMQDHRKFGS